MIFKMAGINSSSTAIWMSAMTASINFLFTFVGLYLVEKVGRRPLILASLLGELNMPGSINAKGNFLSEL